MSYSDTLLNMKKYGFLCLLLTAGFLALLLCLLRDRKDIEHGLSSGEIRTVEVTGSEIYKETVRFSEGPVTGISLNLRYGIGADISGKGFLLSLRNSEGQLVFSDKLCLETIGFLGDRNNEGQLLAVFDEPLPAGTYTLQLRGASLTEADRVRLGVRDSSSALDALLCDGEEVAASDLYLKYYTAAFSSAAVSGRRTLLRILLILEVFLLLALAVTAGMRGIVRGISTPPI